METPKELDVVVLKCDHDRHGLKEGDVGAVVHVYDGAPGFEVEFVTGAGKSVAVITLGVGDVRPLGRQEILHARELVV